MTVRFARPLLGLLLLVATLPAAPIQWKVSDGGNDNWYEFQPAISIFEPIGFEQARAAALAATHLGLPGYLATVTSEDEQNFIESSFPFLFGFGGTATAFLGGSDIDVEGEFRWLDGPEAGELFTYTDWFPGHPTGTGDRLTLLIQFGGNRGWVDTNDGGALGYVVEFGDAQPDSVVPEPSALLLTGLGLAGVAFLRKQRH
ncbi:MAG: C-type lectin domain-containing protein [Bryobacteraceae bacterium]|nr:C-type lectin domain-containing protein [Bryobacteraceae bacterium]